MKRALVLASLLASLPLARAHAQDTAQARAHYDLAQTHVAAGRYDAAYAEFSLGFDLSARPAFLFNMAECALHAGQRDRARVDYSRYLAQAPSGAMAETARQRLAELGPAPAAAPTLAATPTPREEASRNVARSLTQPVRPREIWEEEAFWIVGGSVLAVLITGAILGGVFGAEASGAQCGAGCTVVDFR